MKQALAGEHHNLTDGSIRRAVFLLAVPMILELSLESVFAVVDMFFVSKLGPNAIATVGLTESVITIVYSISIGMCMGATALVSRRVGEKNLSAASLSAAQSILIALVISLLLGLCGVIFAKDILILMGARQEVLSIGVPFARIMLGSSAIIILLFLFNGIFRGAGNATIAMKSLWIASGINILLCPIFIHFFGLEGAAIATVCGRATGVMYQIKFLLRRDGELKIIPSYFKPHLDILKSLANISWPASLQNIIGSGSWVILTRLVSETGGTAASAGYQIAFRCFVFFILPAFGLSNVAATLVGQNLGAKKIDRAIESVRITAKVNAIMMAFVSVFFLLFSDFLVRIFSTDSEVIFYGVRALKIIGSGYVFFGVGMVFTQALNGAGDTKSPSWITFFCFWCFQVPLAYFLAKHTSFGPQGAVLAIPISHFLVMLGGWIAFRKGKWKEIRV